MKSFCEGSCKIDTNTDWCEIYCPKIKKEREEGVKIHGNKERHQTAQQV